jgi:hypothetical protein
VNDTADGVILGPGLTDQTGDRLCHRNSGPYSFTAATTTVPRPMGDEILARATQASDGLDRIMSRVHRRLMQR